MKERLTAILLILTLALFAISAGIAAPILSRSFYQLHVRALDLPGKTGWSETEILEAYDDVMDYLLRDGVFGAGALKWSASGRAHFADVRVLFQLDLWVFGVAAALLVFLLLMTRWIKPHRFLDRGASFWAGSGVLALFLVIGGLGTTNFDRAFTVFHQIFFPGKTNWIFDPCTDEIIQILPEVFFRNCAVLAIGLILVLCILYLCLGGKRKD